MKLKQAIGYVFHKLLDWRTVVNPMTLRFLPEIYPFWSFPADDIDYVYTTITTSSYREAPYYIDDWYILDE